MDHRKQRNSASLACIKKTSVFKRTILSAIIASATMLSSADEADKAKKADDSTAQETVVVTGHKLDDAEEALALKKSFDGINTIMSAEEIKLRPGGNIADILSVLPGLSKFSDMGHGQAATGESEYVSIRGIDSSYNSYLMNGMRIPQADAATRALSLKTIAPYGLGAARILKTPTAQEAGDGIGGVIDIVTPDGFLNGDDYYKITAGGNYSERADERNMDNTGGVVQVEFGNIFGEDEDLGLYATAFYETRHSAAETLEVGNYSKANSVDADQDDWTKLQQGLVATDLRMDFYQTEIERYGGNFSLDKDGENYHWYLRGTYGKYLASGSESQRKIYVSSAEYDSETGDFTPLQVGSNSYWQLRDQKATLANIQFGGQLDATEKLDIAYNIAYGLSELKRPNYIEGSLYSQKVDGGVSLDVTDPSNPKITYSDSATETYITAPDSPRFRKTQAGDYGAENKMYGIKLDAIYTMDSFVDRLKAGLDYNVSDRHQYDRPLVHGNGNYTIEDEDGNPGGSSNPQGPYADEIAGQDVSFMGGLFDDFRVYDRSYFERYMLPVAYTDVFTSTGVPNPGAYTEEDYNKNSVSGTETITALYVQGERAIDDFNIVAGLRYEITDFTADHWLVDGNNSRFVSDGNTYSEVLPNLNVSYRPTDELVFRFALRKSFSRPAFALVAGPERYSYNDDTDELERVSKSNPNLKPVDATNIDFSAEWYPTAASVIEAAVYKKDLDNYIYTSSTTGAAPDALSGESVSNGVTYIMPENGSSAEITGIELHARQYFSMLPEGFDRIGFDVTATLQNSSADSGIEGRWDTDLPRAPDEIYNAKLFYDADNIKTAITWQRTGLQLLSLTGNRLDKYLQPIETIDLSATYIMDKFSVTGIVENLMDDATFYKTLGDGSTYLGTQDGGGNGSYVETGRRFKVTVSYQL